MFGIDTEEFMRYIFHENIETSSKSVWLTLNDKVNVAVSWFAICMLCTKKCTNSICLEDDGDGSE